MIVLVPRIITLVILFGCFASSALAALPADEAKRDASLLEELIERDMSDEQSEAEEALREASEELFPEIELPTGERGPREGNLTDAQFVSLRFGGVPYLLQDVPTSAWFAPYVRDVADRGIVSGYRDPEGIPTGFFGPADPVTLEQLSKMAIETARLDQTVCPAVPRNVTASGSWSAKYVSCAEHYGFASFVSSDADVKQPALRSHVVMTILEAFAAKFIEAPSGTVFTDVPATAEFASAIETAARDGIVSGYADPDGNATGLFGPQDDVKRAEVAKVVSLALQVYGK